MCEPSSLYLNVAVDEKALRQQSKRLRQFLDRHEVAPKVIYNAELVLEEMVGNVIRHGDATENIRFIVQMEGNGILITIIDNGVPFDPSGMSQPEIPDAAANAPVGGLGIHMVRCAVDQMVYQRLERENRLEIRMGMDAPPA